MIVLLN
jgi:ubiquitin-conjugating enzyme E2 N